MTTYFISTSGSDSTGNGTQGTPWRTFAKGLTVLNPGDSLLARGGTYTEQINSGNQTIPQGNSSNYITIGRFQQEPVILQPSGVGNVINLYAYNTSYDIQYLILDGLILDGSGASSEVFNILGDEEAGIAHKCHHIIFQNGEVRNSITVSNPGTQTAPPNIHIDGHNITFLNSRSHHSGSAYGFYAIGSDLVIDNCEIDNNYGYGFQLYRSPSPNPNRVNFTLRNCTIHNNGAIGNVYGANALTLNHTNNILVYNNTIYNNNYGAIRIFYGNAQNPHIYNNTIYNNGNVTGGDPAPIYFFSGVSNARIVNNIFLNNSGGPTHYIDDAGIGTFSSNNFTSDPSFVNSGTGDFRLQSSSPAIGYGTDLSSDFTTDKAGNLRTIPFDAGAYEFVSIVIPVTITCDDSLKWELVSSGIFANNTLRKTVNFSVRPARWICLRGISEINSNSWASCAEFMGLVNGISLLQTKGIMLTWDHANPEDAAIKFRVYRQPGCTGAFTPIGDVPYPTVSYYDTDVIAGSLYCYDVTALDYLGRESGVSNVVSATAPSILSHSIWCFSTEETVAENGRAVNAIDGLTNTFWHTRYSSNTPSYPHNIVVDLGAVYPLNGFTYLPRQDGQTNGTIAQYEFYICDYFMPKGRDMHLHMMQPLLAM